VYKDLELRAALQWAGDHPIAVCAYNDDNGVERCRRSMAFSRPEEGNPAMRSPLAPDVQLDVLLSAICGRNQYTCNPSPVLAELIAASRGRADILARVAGIWSGYHDSPATRPLADALRQIPCAETWVAEGKRRRRIPAHGAPIEKK
jgi:hypothetical protein